MNMPKSFVTPVLYLVVLALTGCGPSAAQMTATIQAAEIMTLTAAPTDTPSPSPVPTDTPSPTVTATTTSSPTPSETPTMTPSPTPDRVMPGNYSGGGCGSADMRQGGQLEFCVTGVTVNNDGHMFFAVRWTLSNIPGIYTVTKRSDEGNRNMYLTDNLGKRYDHIAGGGAAYASVGVISGVPVSGWFDFGTGAVGAFTFDFHDDDNGILITGISLYPGTGAGIITYEDFALDSYPLLLQYAKELWNITKSDDGTSKLINNNLPACTVQAQAARQPKGDFKSQVPVGEITYAIYGYFDEAVNLYIREYVYVSGLPGVNADLKPFFYVTIPPDNTTDCILYASNLLSSLAPQKP